MLDGLQVIGRVEIADRAVFVVKGLAGIGAFAVARDQMFEHMVMALHVIAQVHAHKARQLQKAWIDPPPGTGILQRYGRDHGVREPFERALHGQIVDAGWRLAGINRAAHHGQRRRAARMLVCRHDRGHRQRRHRGLTHRQHVRAGANVLKKHLQIVDIIVEIELTRAQRDHLGVGPVGHVNLAALDHPRHGTAQQCGKVPAHRRDDQQLGRVLGQAFVRKAQQVAPRAVHYDGLGHRIGRAVQLGGFDVEGRFAVRRAGMGEHFQG